MKTRRLGRTGFKVSEIGFGGWAIGGDVSGRAAWGGYGPADDEASRAAIRRALELGVTLFDTADVFGHGHSEALIGEVIDAWPEKERVVLVTKGGINFYRPGEEPEPDFTPYAIANAVQHSRARLRRDRIDVYLLMNPPVEMLLEKEHVRETLAALQRADYIGATGVSVGSVGDAVALLKSDYPLDVIELPFSLFDQAAIREALPLAGKRRVGVIAREPLANGFLAGKYDAGTQFPASDLRAGMPPEYRAALAGTAAELKGLLEEPNRTLAQAALRFVLDEPGVTCAIPGAKTAAQVEENARTAEIAPLTAAERLGIHSVFFPQDEETEGIEEE